MQQQPMKAPFYPIIYVRGYAMSRGEIDETTADPFCGFNLGSTVMRAVATAGAPPRKFVFESPVIRLASQFGYGDVYEDGYDVLDPNWLAQKNNKLAARSIVIYRYYDPASTLLGVGKTPSMEQFAQGLNELILHLRDLAFANPANELAKKEDFRCHLVAHSMGGLVCRTFLQNPACGSPEARATVDKFFTYATPHNGIDVAGLNVPAFSLPFDIDNFNRDKRMREYLRLTKLPKGYDKVDLLPENALPSSRVFCMVGTNRSDYEVAAGLSRTFVGHGSDGLVRIENATLHGLNADGTLGEECAKAFAYRAHSGFFGIVNSEESFQNLVRFLFGNVRVDIWLDIDELRLPKEVLDAAKGDPVNALYQIELLASPRSKPWYLSRRTAEEDSAACLTQADWKPGTQLYLSSVFLAEFGKVDPELPGLAYSLTLGVRVPDYEIDKRFWPNSHYEGSYLYRDTVIIQLERPTDGSDQWTIRYAWQNTGMNTATIPLQAKELDGSGIQVLLPIDSDVHGNPDAAAIKGQVRLMVSTWNPEGTWP
ncbi:hypothetical protein [Pseudomonas citronellolis]|uniref:hypothetical protein n=1 Tax=Pseudomonas citronellolis TaxID=53408 RepID=UPI00248E80BE|nr:hypothetical protein [Pseudomonas citronellolis]